MDPLQLIRLNNLFAPSNPPTTPAFNPNAPWDHVQEGELFKPKTTNRMEGMFEAPPIRMNDPISSMGGRGVPLGENKPVEDNDILSLIDRLYKPETTYSDMYKRTLDEMPVRNKPGVGRKIAGSILGFLGGPEAAEITLHGGYGRRMSDWNERMNAIEPGLTAERNTNSNNRQLALQSATAALNERRLTETERKNKVSEDIANRKLALDAIKAQGWKLKTGEDGFVYAISADGSQTRKTDVKSGELSEAEKIRLQLDSSLQQIEARGAIQTDINNADNAANKAIADARLAQQTELVNLRADLQRQLLEQRYELMGQNKWSNPVQAFDKEGKPLPYFLSINGVTGEVKKIESDAYSRVAAPGSGGGSGSSSTQSETQIAAGITNRAQQIATQNANWAKYIKFDGTGSGRRFKEITRPGWFGPDQETYNKIYEAIYQKPFTATAATPPTPAPTKTTKPPKPTNKPDKGYVILFNKKQNVWGQVPESQKKQALDSKEFEE